MIAIIPARGGSTRIPGKNTKDFHGKPIIKHSIEIAERSGLFGAIIVSSDSSEILKIAGVWSHERPEELSRNEIGTQQVMRDAIINGPGDSEIYCCVYPTAPLMAPEDLWRGYGLLKSNRNMKYSFSVGTNPLSDAGQFYFGYKEAFLSGAPLFAEHSIMVPIDESRVQDINTYEDWIKAEEKYKRLNK